MGAYRRIDPVLLTATRLEAAGKAQANPADAPLHWLMRRGKISLGQYAAGERLRADYELAGKGPRAIAVTGVALAGDAPEPDGRANPALAARERFEGAMRAAGPGLSDVLWRIVLNGDALAWVERDMAWPVRAAAVVLALALDRVADHYAR